MRKVTVASLAFAAALTVSSISNAEPQPPAPAAPAVKNEPLPASQRAYERRRMFVGIVGFAALTLGLTGLWLLRRSRTRQQAAPQPEPSVATVAVSEPAPSSKAGKAGGVMVCPTCRSEYTAEARFCKLDGNRLVALREGTDTRGPAGGICPVCGQGYDPGIPACPVHQEELVPAALYQARERTSGSFPKICPTCGVQYANGSGFCGADGSALVTIN